MVRLQGPPVWCRRCVLRLKSLTYPSNSFWRRAQHKASAVPRPQLLSALPRHSTDSSWLEPPSTRLYSSLRLSERIWPSTCRPKPPPVSSSRARHKAQRRAVFHTEHRTSAVRTMRSPLSTRGWPSTQPAKGRALGGIRLGPGPGRARRYRHSSRRATGGPRSGAQAPARRGNNGGAAMAVRQWRRGVRGVLGTAAGPTAGPAAGAARPRRAGGGGGLEAGGGKRTFLSVSCGVREGFQS